MCWMACWRGARRRRPRRPPRRSGGARRAAASCGPGRRCESSRSRRHSGWSISVGEVVGDRDQHGVAGGVGELAVEEAVGVAPARAAARGRSGRASRPSTSAARRSRDRRCGAPRGQRGDRRLEDAARLEHGGRAGVGGEVEPGGHGLRRAASARSASAATNEPAPGRVSTMPRSWSAAERLADGRAADAEAAGPGRARRAGGRRGRGRRGGSRPRGGRRSARSAGGPAEWLVGIGSADAGPVTEPVVR